MSDTPDQNAPADPANPWRSRPCPICRKMSDRKYHPFCSRRCADVDLGRWLGGRYALPAAMADDEDGRGDGLGDGPAEEEGPPAGGRRNE